MVCVKHRGHMPGVPQFIVARLCESDREGLELHVRGARHQGHDGARIDSAAQERADRDITDLMQYHRFAKPLSQLLDKIFLRCALVWFEMQVPVALNPNV